VGTCMRKFWYGSAFLLVGCFALAGTGRLESADPAAGKENSAGKENTAEVDFLRDIKPILSNNCFQCHGPDDASRKGGSDGAAGLRLDTAAGAQAEHGGQRAITPGNLETSVAWQRVNSTDPNEQMPPPQTGKALTQRERELLARWIKQGAKYAQHWSYVKPVRPVPPAVAGSTWPRNDVDRFILARLEREGLTPSPEADRATLIRRLSLDVTGLPPTLAEVNEFVQDPDPHAYEKLVDRLLKKESYGEHWAQQWLDLARYADSAGYADDPARTIWLYRDYVIRAYNANKPFDQFTLEQLAGDLLPNPTDEQLIATAFHRNTLTNNEGGTNDEEFRNVAVVDRVSTTFAVWMGTTMSCAQCHNHKYDPLSQEEFFRFFAFFNSTEDADRGNESPLHSVFTAEQQAKRGALQQEIKSLEEQLKRPTPELSARFARWDDEFPRDLSWQQLKPSAVTTKNMTPARIVEDGAVRVDKTATTDTYRVELPLAAGSLRAVGLAALPHADLPAQGPGHGGGNFVIAKISAVLLPPVEKPGERPRLQGRFVRIELPGKQKMLSLAEVQVFRDAENVAIKGDATQSSTDYDGPAKLAIDGNTNGKYVEAKSTTHTAVSDDPWWEVDLKSAGPLDRVVVWNRTDPSVEERLANYRVVVLNDNREVVWKKEVAAVPKPSAEFSLDGARVIEFSSAVADYSQPEFGAELVLTNADAAKKGWAVGGRFGQTHTLTLITKAPIDVPAGSTLALTIEHAVNPPGHTLGHFQVLATGDARAAEWGRTPGPLQAILQKPLAQRSAEQTEQLLQYFLSIAPELQPQREQLAKSQKQLAEIQPATVPVMKELPENQRRVTKIQHRGNFLDLGAEVKPGTPSVFPVLPANEPLNRLTIARWLMSDENPLTARVLANRYWEQLFGVGIVATSEEFGAQGDLPFHPELLDWLATELPRTKWDLKNFVRLLVTSATYRQSSKVSAELVRRDPDNRLLARGPRFRLPAETVRDQALAVSGLLSSKMFGPPVKPPQPSLGVSAAFGSGIDWQTSAGDDKFRRGIYTMWRRSNPYPSMATFDAPNREVCTLRRVRTNTPLQALVTLNDPVYIEASQAIARRVLAEGGADSASRVQFAFQICLARPAQEAELKRLVQLVERVRESYQGRPEEARKMATDPIGPVPSGMDVADLAAWTVVGNVLLNLDEMVMKR
jgi:mono/diheme cytochrome c family protein